jgi:hypothetical protein
MVKFVSKVNEKSLEHICKQYHSLSCTILEDNIVMNIIQNPGANNKNPFYLLQSLMRTSRLKFFFFLSLYCGLEDKVF